MEEAVLDVTEIINVIGGGIVAVALFILGCAVLVDHARMDRAESIDEEHASQLDSAMEGIQMNMELTKLDARRFVSIFAFITKFLSQHTESNIFF